MAETIDWPQRPRKPRHRGRILLIAALAAILFGGGTVLSYYVEALWFESLGYVDVFWKTLNLQGLVFAVCFLVTFVVLYGSYLVLKPARLGDLTNVPILINGQPIKLPVEPVLRLIAVGFSFAVAAVTGAGLMEEWPTFALYWYAPPAASPVDPIFGRPLTFYFFTLPAWQTVSGWFMTLALIVCGVAAFFVLVTGGPAALAGRKSVDARPAWRGLSVSFAVLLLVLAFRVFLGRYDRLFDEHTIFTGVTYTDAHISITGTLIVVWALV